jgi:O-antigen ligase
VQNRTTQIQYTGAESGGRGIRGWAQAQVGLVVALVGLGITGFVVARIATNFEPYYAVAVVLCLAFGVFVAYKPELGLLAFFVVAPLTIGSSPEMESQSSDYGAGLLPCELVLAFLLIMWLGRMFLTGRWKLAPSGLNKPMAVLAGMAIASLLCAQIISDPGIPQKHHLLISQVAEVGLFLLAAGAFFLASNTLQDPKRIKSIFYPVVAIGVYAALFKFSDLPMIVPANWCILLACIAAAYIMAKLFFGAPKPAAAFALVVGLIICFAAAFSSYDWISGLIAITVTAMTILFLKSRKLFAYVAVALVLLAVVGKPLLSGMYATSEQQGDFDRLAIWSDAAHMAMSTNPVLGIGPGNYYPYSFKYGSIWYGANTYSTAHNNYAQVGAEMGIVGLVVLLWLIYSGIKMGLKLFRETRADLKWVPAAATSILAGFAASSILGDYMFPNRANGGLMHFGISVYIWLTLGAAVAASRVPALEGAALEA